MNKSFRGKLADNSFDRIRLSTNNGLTGYQIVKFKLMPHEPGGLAGEHVVQVYSTEPETNESTVNFSNPLLLASGYASNSTSGDSQPTRQSVIFDNMKFNQDIFVSHRIRNGSGDVNYYIELEQVKLDVNEAAVATLKDMRGRE